MKIIFRLTSFFLFTLSISNAQVWSPFLKIDTLTVGEFDDSHPIIDHSSFDYGSVSDPWLVFERQTNSESMIAAKSFISYSEGWDTAVSIISSRPIFEELRFPEIATVSYPSYGKTVRHTIVAWQQKADSVSNIYFSVFKYDSTGWGNPLPLTSGTSSSTRVRVVPYYDSTFMATWKNNNSIFFSFISPSAISPAETLAVSNYDSCEYDIGYMYSEGRIIWTARDSANQTLFIERSIESYPSFSLTDPETLSVRGDIWNPRFAYYFSSYSPVLYESSIHGKHNIYVLWGRDTTNISNDPNADYRNARTFTAPVITKHLSKSSSFYFGVFVAERNSASDSSLLFEYSAISCDTVTSTGHDRDACVGSWFIPIPYYSSPGVPVVWESNRSGKRHIYSRFVLMPLGDVRDEKTAARHFELSQNFPNPFNPSTIIRFQLSNAATVSLKIFDVLGRELQTLIEQKLMPGNYSASWDGTRFASGVYFCRLQAGDFVQTKKLLLLK